MDLSIAIVSWNTKKILCDCLTSLYEHTMDIEFEVIVVDNASSDGTPDTIRKAFPQVKVIDSGANLGFAKANNIALESACGRHFLLLNPDTIVIDNSLKYMVDFLDEDPVKRGAVGPCVLNDDKTLQQSWAKLPTFLSEARGVLDRTLCDGTAPNTVADVKNRNPFKCGWIGGCCMMVTKNAINKIGKMDEQIFMYSEETDWCKRLWDCNFEVWLNTKATIIHYGGKSSEQASERAKKQLIKSKMYYFEKHKNRFTAILLGLVLTTKMYLRKIRG